jgi:hypothetical protein
VKSPPWHLYRIAKPRSYGYGPMDWTHADSCPCHFTRSELLVGEVDISFDIHCAYAWHRKEPTKGGHLVQEVDDRLARIRKGASS